MVEKLLCPYRVSLESGHVQAPRFLRHRTCRQQQKLKHSLGENVSLSVLLLENAFKFLPKQEIVICKKFIWAHQGCHCSNIALLFSPYLWWSTLWKTKQIQMGKFINQKIWIPCSWKSMILCSQPPLSVMGSAMKRCQNYCKRPGLCLP